MKILAVAEQRDNRFKKTAFEVARTARVLADQLASEVVGLVIGNNTKSIAGELGGYGAQRVIVVDNPRLGTYSTTAYSKVVSEVAMKEQASIVLLAATAMGKDCAPRVAVKLDAGLAADCTALKVNSGEIVATRPVYAGKVSTEIKVTSPTKVFTLRPNVFASGTSSGSAAAVDQVDIELVENDFGSTVKEVTQSSGKIDVAEADIIVTGGRGFRRSCRCLACGCRCGMATAR